MIATADNNAQHEFSWIHLLGLKNQASIGLVKENFKNRQNTNDVENMDNRCNKSSFTGTSRRRLYTIYEEFSFCLEDNEVLTDGSLSRTSKSMRDSCNNLSYFLNKSDDQERDETFRSNDIIDKWGQFVTNDGHVAQEIPMNYYSGELKGYSINHPQRNISTSTAA